MPAELLALPESRVSVAQQRAQPASSELLVDLLVAPVVPLPAADLHRQLVDLLADLYLDPLNITSLDFARDYSPFFD